MRKYLLILAVISTVVYSCTKSITNASSDVRLQALPLKATEPANNLGTTEKIALGKALFWDPILSGNKDVACVSCHHPQNDYAELMELSLGVGASGIAPNRTNGTLVKRNAMTILNTAHNGITHTAGMDPLNAPMFWDNRILSLEAQAIEPILSSEEMKGTSIAKEAIIDTVLNRLRNIPEYVVLFENVFGANSINQVNLGKAIAAFERTLNTPNSKFDQYKRGDLTALNELELRGLNNFVAAGCINCHNGPMFSDGKLHVLTVPENKKLSTPDNGDGKNLFAFRTGSLRNLPKTGPYMHNGVFNSLEDVLEFYDEASEGSQNPNVPNNKRDPLLNQVNVNDNQAASIIAFIKTLNSDDFDKTVLTEVPSKLKAGGK